MGTTGTRDEWVFEPNVTRWVVHIDSDQTEDMLLYVNARTARSARSQAQMLYWNEYGVALEDQRVLYVRDENGGTH